MTVFKNFTPRSAMSLEALAQGYLSQGRFAAAAGLYAAINQLWPGHPRAALAAAFAQLRSGEPERALAWLEQVQLPDETALVHLLRAKALSACGRQQEAAAAIDHYLSERHARAGTFR